MQGQGGRSRGNGISIHASDVVGTNGLCGVGRRRDKSTATVQLQQHPLADHVRTGLQRGCGRRPARNRELRCPGSHLRQDLQQQDALQPAAVHRQRSRAVDLPSPVAQIPRERKKPTHMDARLGLKHKKRRVHKQMGADHIQAMAAPLPLERSPATFGGPLRFSRIPATR